MEHITNRERKINRMSDDTISRQAAIEAITDERIATNMDSVYDSELHRCKRATHRILASLPSAKQWIPVTERLPEDVQIGEEYPNVVFCTKEKTYTGFYEYYLGGRWWTTDCDEVVDGVIAWMPLPEPYKEDKKE